ncbi:hypothetical protein N7492_004153 [Penicillium capsulatum]|uniref:MARVEL domain-containing protein n=1 Tax=Penicillium capsulatum TaxID=69766 RepID=A0A9W9IKT1_9EURO|nr:hypothetical protein N7492_004153 [Penicillium capsulatum]KAJ6121277.1 hypothetical protein N7512_003742 [Penicillium capsulatum]
MLAFHLVLVALLGFSLALAIAQLGLTAYVVSSRDNSHREITYSFAQGYSDHTVRASTPGIYSFLVFAACWTILITLAALVLPCLCTRKGRPAGRLNAFLGIGLTVVYLATMVFWLAGFADLVAKFGVDGSDDYTNAIVALAIVLWVLFLVLFILVILAICGVLEAEWSGYRSMRKSQEPPATPTTNAPVAKAPISVAPVHDVPIDTTPVAPSELSTHDTEALRHHQPHSQSQSTSSPSAVASVELSGDSIYREHPALRS